MSQAKVIVVGNEKGGAGKSTIAIHVATALLHAGAKVATLDLDVRQQSMAHFFAHRRAWLDANGAAAPMPLEFQLPAELAKAADADALAQFEDAFGRAAEQADFVLIDTPGSDTAIGRAAHGQADLVVTPMNDSFVDFDLIGQVDAESFKVKRLSFYAELIWETRKKRAMATIREQRREMDWVVVRNRTGHVEARNMTRIEQALTELSKRVGFRTSHGLSERVIYRELFPSGLTLLDKGHLGELGTSHLVARQELRSLIAALNLPMPAGAQQPARRIAAG